MHLSLGRRVFIGMSAAFLVVAALAAPASAAPPPNDSIRSATALGVPPTRFVVDTSDATASSADGSCVVGSSVWFRSRPGITRTVRISTLGSDYDTVLAVFRGPRDNRTRIACADDSFESSTASARQVRFVAGNTYWVAVSACCTGTARGGQLVLNTFLPRAAGATTTIEDVETGTVSGRLLVQGTSRCATPSELQLSVTANQRVGPNVARGEGFFSGVCGPTTSPWTAVVDSQTGWAFQAGSAVVTWGGFAGDAFDFVRVGPETRTFTVTERPDARVVGRAP